MVVIIIILLLYLIINIIIVIIHLSNVIPFTMIIMIIDQKYVL